MADSGAAAPTDVPGLEGVESRMRIRPATEPATTAGKTPPTAAPAKTRKARTAKASPTGLPPTAGSGGGLIDPSAYAAKTDPSRDESPDAADMLLDELSKATAAAKVEDDYRPLPYEWYTPLPRARRRRLFRDTSYRPGHIASGSPAILETDPVPKYLLAAWPGPKELEADREAVADATSIAGIDSIPYVIPRALYFFHGAARNEWSKTGMVPHYVETVCGVPLTARLGAVADDDRPDTVNRIDFMRWAWEAYTGALFSVNDDASVFPDAEIATRAYITNRLDYRPKELPAVPEPAADHDASQSLSDAVDAAFAASATGARTRPGKVDPNVGIARPNGELYFPRKVRTTTAKVRAAAKDAAYDVETLRRAREAAIPVLLTGAPGTGKSAMVEAAFADAITVPGTADTETADFLGGYIQLPDESYEWVDGPLLEAMEQGRPLFIDEIALIDSRVLAVVYSVMDGRGELRVTANPKRGVVRAAKGFYVVGACNPNVPGAVMSDALLSRFALQIEVTTDYGLAHRLGVVPEIITVAQNLHDLAVNGTLMRAPQMRNLLDFQKIADTFGRETALANFVATADETDREEYVTRLSSVFGVKIDALRI